MRNGFYHLCLKLRQFLVPFFLQVLKLTHQKVFMALKQLV